MPRSSASAAGASAVAAMKKGEIDAISHLDPVIAKLEADGDIEVLIDTRTESRHARRCSAARTRRRCSTRRRTSSTRTRTRRSARQRLLEGAEVDRDAPRPEQIADSVPPEYHLGDKALYLKAVAELAGELLAQRHRPARSGMESTLDMLRTARSRAEGRQGRSREDLRRPLRQARGGVTALPG